jgi:hypothetical protein
MIPRIRWWIAAAMTTSLVAAPARVTAQVVRGQVRELTTRAAVTGAAIVFRDSLGVVAGFTQTDESGAFQIRVPFPKFVLRAMRVGFAPESLSTMGADQADTLNVLIEMRAIPMLLSPVIIADERRRIRDTRVLGLNLHAMSTDLMTPSQIAATSRGARTYLDAIASLLPAGVLVSNRSQCVVMNRGTRINGQQACAMVVVDGIRQDDPATALDLVQPQWLDHAIFVRAADAGLRFGTGAAGGVLLLFTKYGSYALEKD